MLAVIQYKFDALLLSSLNQFDVEFYFGQFPIVWCAWLYSMLTATTDTVPINITSQWLKPLVDYCSFLPLNMTHHMQLKVIKATIANLAILRRMTWIVSTTDANTEVESANQMTSAWSPCHVKYQSRTHCAHAIFWRELRHGKLVFFVFFSNIACVAGACFFRAKGEISRGL